MKLQKETLKPKKKVKYQIYVTQKQSELLEADSAQMDITISEVIRNILFTYYEYSKCEE